MYLRGRRGRRRGREPPPFRSSKRDSPNTTDGDGFVNVNDLGALLASFNKSIGHPDYNPCADFDVDGSGCDGTVNIVDQGVLLAEFGTTCASQHCPPVGQTVFTLHGRPIETLPDGKTLLHVRARVYDPQHGRWLQRDPSGYVGGANLYESFMSNATAHTDPSGRECGSMPRRSQRTMRAAAQSGSSITRDIRPDSTWASGLA